MPVVNGSTNVPLRWNYTLSPGSLLLLTEFYIVNGRIKSPIGIRTNDGIGAVNKGYETRWNISGSEVATLIINKVTEREEAVFQCKLFVFGNSWAYNIRVVVTG